VGNSSLRDLLQASGVHQTSEACSVKWEFDAPSLEEVAEIVASFKKLDSVKSVKVKTSVTTHVEIEVKGKFTYHKYRPVYAIETLICDQFPNYRIDFNIVPTA